MKHLPNFITLLNLLCGSLAVTLALLGHPATASYLIIAGYFFDVMDGLAARLLRVQTAIGKELDSLADIITFGLAPSAILFQLGLPEGGFDALIEGNLGKTILAFIPFLLTISAGFRLAKFNVDERQTDRFIGVPTPANGIMALALPLILRYQPDGFVAGWIESGYLVPVYSLVVSYLMISPLKLYSLKIKGMSWDTNKYAYLAILLAILFLTAFGFTGIFLGVPVYLIYVFLLDISKSRAKP
jgi:CDP-diacylglycerol--serine O-phosphatidyltransferase